MASETDFNRALRRSVEKRLGEGQSREALLAELKTRLDPERAEALVAEAAGKVGDGPRVRPSAGPSRGPSLWSGPWDERVAAGFAGIWAAVLLVQNLGIVIVASQTLSAEVVNIRPLQLLLYLLLGAFKLVLLVTAGGLFFFSRSRYRIELMGGAILYAFPVGPLVEGVITKAILGQPVVAHFENLATTSALLSYAAAGALGFLWWRARHRPGPEVVTEHFT